MKKLKGASKKQRAAVEAAVKKAVSKELAAAAQKNGHAEARKTGRADVVPAAVRRAVEHAFDEVDKLAEKYGADVDAGDVARAARRAVADSGVTVGGEKPAAVESGAGSHADPRGPPRSARASQLSGDESAWADEDQQYDDSAERTERLLKNRVKADKSAAALPKEKKKVKAGTVSAAAHRRNVEKFEARKDTVYAATDELRGLTGGESADEPEAGTNGAGAACGSDGGFFECRAAADTKAGERDSDRCVGVAGVSTGCSVSAGSGEEQGHGWVLALGCEAGLRHEERDEEEGRERLVRQRCRGMPQLGHDRCGSCRGGLRGGQGVPLVEHQPHPPTPPRERVRASRRPAVAAGASARSPRSRQPATRARTAAPATAAVTPPAPAPAGPPRSATWRRRPPRSRRRPRRRQRRRRSPTRLRAPRSAR